jgi:hypothetical protein
MPKLTRRRYPERPDCWRVYYGDVRVGTIARRAAGAPRPIGLFDKNHRSMKETAN